MAALLLASASSWTHVAHGQSQENAARGAARKLGYEGVEAFQAGKFAEASEKLEKAYAVLRVPSIGVWSARALVKIGKLVEATERYLEVARLPTSSGDVEIQRKAQAEAQAEAETNQQLTPTLRIRIEGAPASEVSVRLDGASIAPQLVGEPTPLNPGRHKVEGVFNGATVRREATLLASEQQDVTLSFEAAAPAQVAAPAAPEPATPADASPAAPSSTRRTVGWVALGSGAVGLAIGGVAGVLALSERSSLDQNPACADRLCPHQYADQVDSLNTARTVSTVGFLAGGALAVTGFVLVLTAPRSKEAPSTALYFSPTSAVLRGSF